MRYLEISIYDESKEVNTQNALLIEEEFEFEEHKELIEDIVNEEDSGIIIKEDADYSIPPSLLSQLPFWGYLYTQSSSEYDGVVTVDSEDEVKYLGFNILKEKWFLVPIDPKIARKLIKLFKKKK